MCCYKYILQSVWYKFGISIYFWETSVTVVNLIHYRSFEMILISMSWKLEWLFWSSKLSIVFPSVLSLSCLYINFSLFRTNEGLVPNRLLLNLFSSKLIEFKTKPPGMQGIMAYFFLIELPIAFYKGEGGKANWWSFPLQNHWSSFNQTWHNILFK